MKYLTVIFCAVIVPVYGQWLPQPYTTGNIYFNTGNVGIGYASPSYTLDVSGVVRSRYDLRTTVVGTGNGYFADDGSGSTIFSITRQANNETRFQSYGFITFRTMYSGGTERMRITDDGKVGIGITAPYTNARLHIKSPAPYPWGFVSEASGNDRMIGVGHDGTYGVIATSYLGGSGHSHMQLRTSNLSRMVVGVDGNVGIGMDNPPAVKFEVRGDVNVGSQLTSEAGYGSALGFLGASANGDALWVARYNNGANQSELRVNIGDDLGQHEDKFVVGTNYWSDGQWYPHLSALASGRVGINTATPRTRFHVYGDKIPAVNNTDATEVLRVTREGSGSGQQEVSMGIFLSKYYGADANSWTRADFRLSNVGSAGNGWGTDLSVMPSVMTFLGNGNVGIGTTNPGSTFKLAVEGKIGAREINVTTAAWSDYVFDDDYELPPLTEVRAFIKEHHHLPDVPSEKEVLQNGQNLGEMNAVLLKKIEELMLYQIKSDERVEMLELQVSQLLSSKEK